MKTKGKELIIYLDGKPIGIGKATMVPIEPPNITEWSDTLRLAEELNLRYTSIADQMLKEMREKENEILEFAVRTIAVPPVKGKITKGKLLWRGIRLVQKGDFGSKLERWLEQRGKKISPVLVYNFTLNLPPPYSEENMNKKPGQ